MVFKKLAASAFGLSKIGVFVSGEDLQKADASNYILDQLEQIYYLIKTKTDEYCFTNRALIHVDGTSLESKRNVLHRYDYHSFIIEQVYLETAGSMDIDAEIKIIIKPVSELMPKEHEKHPPLKAALVKKPSEIEISIDIHRDDLDNLKALYKTLVSISQKQKQNIQYLNSSEKTLGMAFNSLVAGKSEDNSSSSVFREITDFADQWMIGKKEMYANDDFTNIFEENIPVSYNDLPEE